MFIFILFKKCCFFNLRIILKNMIHKEYGKYTSFRKFNIKNLNIKGKGGSSSKFKKI